MRSIYQGVLLVCFLEFLSIQKEAEEAENEQVVRKKKSHLIEDLKVGKTVLDNFEDLKMGKIVLDNFEGKSVFDNLINFLHQIVLLTAKFRFRPEPTCRGSDRVTLKRAFTTNHIQLLDRYLGL